MGNTPGGLTPHMATAVVATSYGGPEVLALVESALADPGPGQVIVEVRAAGVNPIDHKLISGAMGADPAKLPRPVGLEVAGVVRAVGPDAEGPAGPLSPGDEVIVYPVTGGYADAVVASAAVTVPKPAGLPWPEASALLLVGSTAVHALAVVDVQPGQTLLVHGASGSVGQVAVQLAVQAGASVVATAAERNHELLRDYGAVPVTYGPGLADRVRTAAPNGVDAAIDTVGTDEAVDVSLELVADRAQIVSVAAFGRADTGIRLIGGGPGADPGTEIRADAWKQLLPAATAGTLKVVVSRTYPLDRAADALGFVKDGHAAGKVVLLP